MKKLHLPAGLCLCSILFFACDKGNLPRHPHKDESQKKGNNIVTTGNHITSGPGLTTTDKYPNQLSENLSKHGYHPVAVTIVADDFVNIQAMTAQIGQYVDPHKISGAKNIVIVTEITDDTRDNRQPAQVSMNLLSEYCKHVQAHGWTVIVSTAPYQNPFYVWYPTFPYPDGKTIVSNSGYDSSGFKQQISDINALVRKNQGSFANGIVDLAADPRLQVYSSKYYMPNHIDLTAEGAAVVAELAEAAIKSLLSK